MPGSDKTKKFTTANRAAWEEAAPIHARHNQVKLIEAFSRPGYSCLDSLETLFLNTLGVAGKDVAQVCCNNGRELLSVKNMGAARCVGFDGAEGFLAQGRELAQAAGQELEFVCTDVYDIDDNYAESFDLVTITIGVLGWLPDLPRFFSVLAKLLRPGGALFIYEQHPILDMITPGDADAPLEWELSYFTKEPYQETGGLDYYGGETYVAKPLTSFSHTMAEILMSGIDERSRRGKLRGVSAPHFQYLVERGEGKAIGLPMCYTLVMRKGA